MKMKQTRQTSENQVEFSIRVGSKAKLESHICCKGLENLGLVLALKSQGRARVAL